MVSCDPFDTSWREEIHKTITSNCDCHDIRYKSLWRNFTERIVNIELIGCEYENLENEKNRLYELLDSNVKDFRTVKEINIVFIKEMKTNSMKIRYGNYK
jgi:hypothetical protein